MRRAYGTIAVNLSVRAAIASDAEAMCAVLNPIIARGGTTAHQRAFDAARMTSHYLEPPLRISATVACLDGKIVGFQSLEWSNPDWQGDGTLPRDWGIIASFVENGQQGRGIGRALFAATLRAASEAGIRSIDATIRADNAAGLAYYSSLGFVDYGRFELVPLRDGTAVDRIRKRLDL